MPRISGNSFFNGSFIFVDYAESQNVGANTSTISWILGFHYGNAHFRIDNARCTFGGGPISGDPNGGPIYTGWPAPGGQNTDIGLDSGSFTITHDSSGNRTVTITASMSSDFGSSSINTSFALPHIPQSPISPSNASATRVNDGRIDVSWNNNDSGTRPYANVKVYRRVNGGSWQLRATLGVVESYQDTSVSANNKYEYRMSALGVNGAEVGYATSNAAWTTPATPSGCTAVRLSNGDVRVTWNNNVRYSEYTTRIEHSTNEGLSWSEISSVGSGVSQYTHPNPTNNDSHKYRVRTRTSSGPQLNSGYSTQPGIIFADPASPSSATATRVNDGQASVSWTNNITSEAPYQNIRVYRRSNGGSWVLRATIGVVTSYSDTSISANNKYEYRISAIGSSGAEVGFAQTNAIFTTPAVNTNLTATKLANNNIRVTWTVNSNYRGVGDLQHDLYDSPDGENWTFLATVFGSTATYEHVAPDNLVTHRYRTVTYPPGTTLFATSAASNIIQLLATANAPTNLSPSGVARDANEPITLSWTHNPADGTPQTSYRIQYEVDGGGTVTAGPFVSGASTHVLPADTLANGHTITWRVATAGQNGILSPNSANGSFTTRDRPTSTVNVPSGGVYNSSRLTVDWSYFQSQGSPQASWRAVLYRDNGDSTYTVIEERTGTTENQVLFNTTLLDGLNYAVRVYVTSSDGLVSIDSSTELESFVVAYLPPADVSIFAHYSEDDGFMLVTLVPSSPEPGVTEEIASIDLQRQINGGEWVTWAKGLMIPPGQATAVIIDTAPTVNGVNVYRALITSPLPSSAVSAETSVVTSESRWGFLSTGDNFSQVIRMRAQLDRDLVIKREKEIHRFAGRTLPVELAGEHVDIRMNASAVLYGQSSSPRELEELGITGQIALWRDGTGRRMYVSIQDVRISYNADQTVTPVAFSMVNVDYSEHQD